MPKIRQLISFDYAIKNILREKANFDILEGFLSELLHDDLQLSKSWNQKAIKRISMINLTK